MSPASVSCAAVPQLARAAALWAQWGEQHGAGVAALSAAANLLERLQTLSEPSAWPPELDEQQPALRQAVLDKQLAAFNRTLGVLHACHDGLQPVVRELERLSIEAHRAIAPAAGSGLAALAQPSGPAPSVLQSAEAVADMWLLCRDELLLKLAAASLVRLDSSPADTAALLACYAAQPNLERARGRVDGVLAQLRELAPLA